MFTFFKKDEGNILEVDKSEQYHTVEELTRRSGPNSVYYTFLILSVIIITLGLLLKNDAIVIGGVLITPVITPILLFSLGLSILEFGAIRRGGLLMVFSFFIVLLISWILAKVLAVEAATFFLETGNAYTPIVYFFISLVSGIAATLAWTRKEMNDVLPGVAISVSLVPPLALTGIAQSTAALDTVIFYFQVFAFNLIGLILGSIVIYSLLKFYKTRREVQKDVRS